MLTFCDVAAGAGVLPVGTVSSPDGAPAAAAGAVLGTLGSAVATGADCGAWAVCVAVELVPNKEGLPLCTCQLFHSSKSEREKIIQRTVRRISIAPVFKLKPSESPTV